jgi:hypothetical protein
MESFIRSEPVTADLGAPLVDGDGARSEYREGYFICAKESAAALRLRTGNNRSAYPVLFLYRHYLELALKDVLARSKVFDLGQSEQKFGHDLEKLWAETKKAMRVFLDDDDLSAVDLAVRAFHSTDKRADAFRYATNPDGDAQLPKNAHVVYHDLIEQMDEVRAGIDLCLDELSRREVELDKAIDEAVAKDRF